MNTNAAPEGAVKFCTDGLHNADRCGQATWTVSSYAPRAICPDLLGLDDLGTADGWRGRMVLAFFRLMKRLTGV